jgi:hypothetical protein
MHLQLHRMHMHLHSHSPQLMRLQEGYYKPEKDPVSSTLLEIVSIADSLSLATSQFLQTQEGTSTEVVAADAAEQMSRQVSTACHADQAAHGSTGLAAVARHTSA